VGAKRLGNLKSHAKIMLVDDEIAVVGSVALAALSLDFRREVAITVDDPTAVGEIEQLFKTIATALAVPAAAGDVSSVSPC
jgi:phosphatidylserine/phosphatidylglycerophosphate/cardiolipin synthase-like enzyme